MVYSVGLVWNGKIVQRNPRRNELSPGVKMEGDNHDVKRFDWNVEEARIHRMWLALVLPRGAHSTDSAGTIVWVVPEGVTVVVGGNHVQ
jgi:hypothetical protein